ncbi:MAG: AsmA family protein [Gammaproteobacteria bacterium]|nr:AsmA family protein [Gammaproteobacteria bacterium]
MQGNVAFSSGSGRPAVAMDLTADHINLVPYQTQEEDEKQKDKKVFSSKKIDLAGLRAVDADISLKAARFLTRDANFRDLELKVALNSGDLRVQSAGGIAGGSLDSDIRFNAAGGTPVFNARLDIKNLLPERLPALQEDPVIREGRTDIHFEGRGAGPSPAAIAASLNGRLLVTTGKGRLLNKATSFAGADVIFSTFRMLNPLAEKEEDSELICGVLNFDIKDGIALAENGIALQTSKVNVLGSGAVDLKTEAIDFRAKPKAREGVGINLAQLGDAVYIGGTLANPRPATDVKGALKTAGTVGTAMATGGLSLLAQGLFSRTFSTDDPCGVALGKKAPGDSEAGQEDAGTAADQKDKSTLEQAGDKVKGAFDSLFGK